MDMRREHKWLGIIDQSLTQNVGSVLILRRAHLYFSLFDPRWT